ncbi:MAG: nucleoside triphosphate pyrophosphohydrolase [Clostridia bacterium]|nr:nucleoside triphosphate pyrophosphohydrolase [Clostridia bacterium]
MGCIRYDKLVRDRIPEIIESGGKTPVTDVMSPDETFEALCAKLSEEVGEYLESYTVEEMADILEVLHGLSENRGIPWNRIEEARVNKREERGGFTRGIRLIEVRDD